MILDVGEYGRFEEESRPIGSFTAGHQSGSFFHTFLTVFNQFVHVSFVVLWTMLSSTIQRISNSLNIRRRHIDVFNGKLLNIYHLADFDQNFLQEFIVNASLDKQASSGNTIFSFVEENAAHALSQLNSCFTLEIENILEEGN